MKLVETDVLPSLDDFTQQLVYCGLDSAITQEIYHVLAEEMDEVAHSAYGLSKSFIPVAETMMARGVLVDAKARDEQAEIISSKIRQLQCCLDFLAEGVWGQGLNPNSPKQLQEFFYEHLFLPKQIASKKGESRVSTDRDTLERLAKNYSRAAPFSNLILAIRDHKKTLDTLTTGLDSNGRWRCNWNLGGTSTGRWSSSAHPFRFGGNLQNITEDLRCVFIPDPDFIMFSCDQQGAEARAVAYYSGDEAYIKAVESGDIHTAVASMVWGFEAKRELSDRKFYRDFSYRDMSKKYTHGCLTGDHEVLTSFGWKNIKEITEQDRVACWNSNNNKIDFDYPQAVITYNYVGNLYTFIGTAYDLTVTADHRIPYIIDGTKNIHVKEAHELPLSAKIPTAAFYSGGFVDFDENEARLIAAAQCDGWISGDGAWMFHLRKQRKIDRLERLLKILNIRYGKYLQKNGTVNIRLSKKDFPAEREMKVAGSWLLGWSASCLDAWLNELPHWDGHIRNSNTMLFSVNKEHLSWVQTIAHLRGKGTTCQGVWESGFGSRVWKYTINNRNFASNKHLKTREVQFVEDVPVFCLTVSTGFFVVRRNDKICITGNSSYGGQARTLAIQAKTEIKMAEDFQYKFFKAFPGIRRWQEWVAREIQTRGELTTCFGLRRIFWGRPWDDATVREAIAFLPQSTVGQLTAICMRTIWERMEPEVQLLANGHDAIIGQIPKKKLDILMPRLLECLNRPIQVKDINGVVRTMTIPWEMSVGENWGKFEPAKDDKPEKNPRGLKKLES